MTGVLNVTIVYIYDIIMSYIFKNVGKCHFFTLLNVV